MSDPLEEAYSKYVNPPPKEEEEEPQVVCPDCGSLDIDQSRGYRGEYTCGSCGHFWKE